MSLYYSKHQSLKMMLISNDINLKKQEQQHVTVGPGIAHCMFIRQVSLQRGTCGPPSLQRTALLLLPPPPPLLLMLMCICNLMIKN